MAKIEVLQHAGEPGYKYASEVIPRAGEYVRFFDGATFKVNEVHYSVPKRGETSVQIYAELLAP
jgi:hypothetical protein